MVVDEQFTILYQGCAPDGMRPIVDPEASVNNRIHHACNRLLSAAMIEKPRNRRAEAADGVRRGGGLRRLPDLLGKVLDPASRRRGLAEVGVLTDWPSIVGADLAARCQPVKLTGSGERGGTLHVHVAGAAALELQHSEPQLLERINGYFGYRAVARLRLIQAPLARPRRARPPACRRSMRAGARRSRRRCSRSPTRPCARRLPASAPRSGRAARCRFPLRQIRETKDR